MTSEQSLLRSSDPVVRTTYRAHIVFYILWGPFQAMIQYAPFLAVKTFNAEAWVPALAAIVPASHLSAVFFTEAIRRSNKTSWVVWPTVLSSLIFVLLVFVRHDQGWLFALLVILAQSLRAPIISAQSAIFRLNYPATARSFALAVPLGLQMLTLALFSFGSGKLFDQSEKWVVPILILSGVLNIFGALMFRRVKVKPSPEPPPRGADLERASSPRFGLFQQFRFLFANRGFFQFQLAYLFFGSGFVAIQAVLPLYLKVEFHPSHEEATLAINTIPMLTTALTFPLWGWMLDRWNPLVLRTLINGVWSLTPLLLFFAGSMEGVYAGQLIQGVVYSGSILIWWLGANYYARAHEVATFMAIHQTLTGVRGVATPFIGIYIAHHIGYKNSMLFWFALMVVGFFIMLNEVLQEKKLGRLRTFSEVEAHLDRPAPASAANESDGA